MPFEELDGSLVLFGRFARRKCPEVAATPRPMIFLERIESVLPGR
jgi:hypothetical protein